VVPGLEIASLVPSSSPYHRGSGVLGLLRSESTDVPGFSPNHVNARIYRTGIQKTRIPARAESPRRSITPPRKAHGLAPSLLLTSTLGVRVESRQITLAVPRLPRAEIERHALRADYHEMISRLSYALPYVQYGLYIPCK